MRAKHQRQPRTAAAPSAVCHAKGVAVSLCESCSEKVSLTYSSPPSRQHVLDSDKRPRVHRVRAWKVPEPDWADVLPSQLQPQLPAGHLRQWQHLHAVPLGHVQQVTEQRRVHQPQRLPRWHLRVDRANAQQRPSVPSLHRGHLFVNRKRRLLHRLVRGSTPRRWSL